MIESRGGHQGEPRLWGYETSIGFSVLRNQLSFPPARLAIYTANIAILVLTYFLLIGVVLLVLLLAPGHHQHNKISLPHLPPEDPGILSLPASPQIHHRESFQIEGNHPLHDEIPSDQELQHDSSNKKPFIPSKPDPVQNIDPRSDTGGYGFRLRFRPRLDPS